MITKAQFPAPFFVLDEYTVHSYHADFARRLCIPAVFNFLQETAWHHAASNGFGWKDLIAKGQIWALSLMKVKIERLPEWGENIQLLTWSRGGKGLYAYRDFEIFNKQDSKLISASSAWLILDAITRRPQRTDDFATQFPSIKERYSMDDVVERQHTKDKPDCKHFFDVSSSDIDMNMHVNNVCYVRWALDSFPIDFLKENALKEITVSFLAEAKEGDRVGCCLLSSDNGKYTIAIVREKDAKQLAQLSLLF